jgi:hypothetical protein
VKNFCGDAGGKRQDGSPCGQGTAPGTLCIWHRVIGDGSEEAQAEHRSRVASLGALSASLPRVLSSDTPMLRLGDAAGCQRALEQTAQQVRLGELSPDRGRVVVESVKTAIQLGHLMLASRIAKLEELEAR